MTVFYDEDRSQVTVYHGTKVYRYIEVPLSVYKHVARVLKSAKSQRSDKLEGKVWQILKKYPEINEKYKGAQLEN